MSRTASLLRDPRVLVFALLAACMGCLGLASLFGVVIDVLVIGVILGISAFYLTYQYPKYSVVIMLASVFFLPLMIKAFYLYDIPTGTAIEAMNFLLVFALIIKRRFAGWKGLPGILVLVWLMLQCLELVNPNASSRIAGFFAIRGTITATIAFFVTYSSIDSKKDVYFLFKWWAFFALLAAVYGLYQEFVGLPSHDFAWASYDEGRYNLLFTWGRLRKFSFFNGPTEFGLVMAYSGVGVLVMAFLDTLSLEKKLALGFMGMLMIWSMIYSGSRTASVILPVGIVIFAAITLWRKVLIFLGIAGLGAAILVIRPTANQSLFVMMTAFQGADDPSMNVRLNNQKIIRSYIQETPLGFGLGSTGELGMKYSPHTFIGSFPPDSELVRIAIETGWIGLLIWCIIMAIVFGYGINGYFTMKDDELKKLMLVPLVVFFMTIIALYPQECFRAPILAMLFSFMMGLIAKLRDMGVGSTQVNNAEDDDDAL